MTGRRPWFRKKRYGWGLEPGSPEGWIATLLFLLIDSGGVFVLIPFVARTQPWILMAWAFGWLAVFIALMIAKGERFW
jgi:hypothetical protein